MKKLTSIAGLLFSIIFLSICTAYVILLDENSVGYPFNYYYLTTKTACFVMIGLAGIITITGDIARIKKSFTAEL